MTGFHIKEFPVSLRKFRNSRDSVLPCCLRPYMPKLNTANPEKAYSWKVAITGAELIDVMTGRPMKRPSILASEAAHEKRKSRLAVL